MADVRDQMFRDSAASMATFYHELTTYLRVHNIAEGTPLTLQDYIQFCDEGRMAHTFARHRGEFCDLVEMWYAREHVRRRQRVSVVMPHETVMLVDAG